MSCIPASHSMSNIIAQAEPDLEESPVERRGSRAYQIFPEVNKNEEADTCDDNILYRRERLPSIVVEPTEHNELKSDNLRGPKPCSSGTSVEEEEEEAGGSADPKGSSDEGEQQRDVTMEPGSGARKSSISPSQSQMSLTHLTPPTSPTPPDAAPPCLRS